VRFIMAAALVNELVEATQNNQVRRLMMRWQKYELQVGVGGKRRYAGRWIARPENGTLAKQSFPPRQASTRIQ
jgi:hypothetical protein